MDRIPNEDEDLLDTDSDDSDYEEGSGSVSDDDLGSGSEDMDDASPGTSSEHSTKKQRDELKKAEFNLLNIDEVDDEDDSDYEEEEEESVNNNSDSDDSSNASSNGSEAASKESDDGSVAIGEAPFTGYIFPAVHKLVSSGNIEGLSQYLVEMFNPDQGGPQVWEVSDSLGRNAIHLSILHGNLSILSLLLEYDLKLLNAKYSLPVDGNEFEKYKYSSIRRKFDDMGIIHLAMSNAPWDDANSVNILQLLYAHPAIDLVPTLDYWKRTPLHIAAMCGKTSLVEFLYEKSPQWLKQNDTFNMMPIHYAIDSKNAAIVEALLALMSPDEDMWGLMTHRHPVTHAVAKCSWECLVLVCGFYGVGLPEKAKEIANQLGIELCGLTDISQNLEAAKKCVVDRSKDSAIIYDLDCLGHIRLPAECDDGHLRLKRIKFVVENPNRLEVLIGQSGSLKTSEFQHVRVIDSVPPCPLTDVVRVHEWSYIWKIIRTVQNAGETMTRLDKGDTNVSSESWSAALKAAGGVIQAMDLVCSETCKNAFVAVRPPGHHVSSFGAVDPNLEDDDTGSNGFCLLNNAAIGAAYALCVHRHVVGKVAIIDFDIHHGNGTEAIVRGLAAPKTRVIPLSFAGLSGQLEMHSHHPWLDTRTDKDSVFFASVHRFDGRFYPQSGQTGMEGNIVNAGLESFSTSEDFRTAFAQLVLPALLQFGPDLIIISAGFDGHVRDRLASGEWDITEEDYYWITEQLVAVANMSCKGRIVSVLEGGYNTRGGWLSPLAQCVASHVRALSSSWANKFDPEDHIQHSDDDSEKHEDLAIIEDTSALLAKADAVLEETLSPSPDSKRMRIDTEENMGQETNEEFTELFGEKLPEI